MYQSHYIHCILAIKNRSTAFVKLLDTHKHLALKMTLLCSLLHSAKLSPWYRLLHDRNLTLTLSMTLTWPLTLTLTSTSKLGNSDVKNTNFGIWPTTLTYNTKLAKVKVNLQTKQQCCRSKSSGVRVVTDRQMDRRTDRRYQVHYLPMKMSVGNLWWATLASMLWWTGRIWSDIRGQNSL